MTRQSKITQLEPEQQDIIARCDDIRARLAELGIPTDIQQELAQLAEMVSSRLSEAHNQAIAVADANARSVEIWNRLDEMALDLRQQNESLQQQNAEISQAKMELERQSMAVAEANIDAVLAMDSSESELADLASRHEQLEQHSAQLQEQSRALADANAEAIAMVGNLEQAAFVDELTGLFNHRYFRENMQLEVARARRYKRNLTLAFVDVDHFKKVNDTYGHPTGDLVLKELATVIGKAIRSADIPVRLDSNPFAARYGGEEFVVILPETDLKNGIMVADRIRGAIEQAAFTDVGGEPIKQVTLSAGVAELRLDDPDDTLEAVVQRADDALYAAKNGGRNRVVAERTAPENSARG